MKRVHPLIVWVAASLGLALGIILSPIVISAAEEVVAPVESAAPTGSPEPLASEAPSDAPSESPTAEPSPSSEPSPSLEPSAEPSVDQSAEPTPEPTPDQTPEPSAPPTPSPAPQTGWVIGDPARTDVPPVRLEIPSNYNPNNPVPAVDASGNYAQPGAYTFYNGGVALGNFMIDPIASRELLELLRSPDCWAGPICGSVILPSDGTINPGTPVIP